ncbi:MAG: hypothetical protein IT374_04560 [Polyangiaceae bacterium]|nr:hypothetical protein [Polyangiaceae bacterium]
MIALVGRARAVRVSPEVARRVVTFGPITQVPGLPPPALGVAVAEGAPCLVLDPLGDGAPDRRVGLLCDVDGEAVLLVAARLASPDEAPGDELDVRAVYGEVEGIIWARSAQRAYERGA